MRSNREIQGQGLYKRVPARGSPISTTNKMLKQTTALIVAAACLLALPIVRAEAENNHNRDRKDPNGKKHPEGYVDHHQRHRTTWTNTHRCTSTICCSSSSTPCKSTVSPPPPPPPPAMAASTVIVPVVPCCTPVETVTKIPDEICNTVVMCGVDNPECNGERTRKIEEMVDRMIEDRDKARIFVNNELIVIGKRKEIIVTSDVAQQQDSSAGTTKSVASALMAIACIVVLALAV